MTLADFTRLRATAWLLSVARPDQQLYAHLRRERVDIDAVINLLHGLIGLHSFSFDGQFGHFEDCIVLPCFGPDGATLVDIVAASIAEPEKFGALIGTGAALGEIYLDHPSTCKIVDTPLQWLKAGCEFTAVILDVEEQRAAA